MSEELEEEVPSWRFHDLRRTITTNIAKLGYRREVADRILAHVPQKSDVTSSVYNLFMYDDRRWRRCRSGRPKSCGSSRACAWFRR
jgi:hypothetical protein